jgi:P-type E1-E2 ATPase
VVAVSLRTITVLVISCPCALGIAIPLARVAGLSIAARNGILVRNFSAFEMADRVGAFVFDKTGTMTEGRWRLLKTITPDDAAETPVLALAAGLEKGSDHPVAREIRRQAVNSGLETLPIQHRLDYANGITGQWDGKTAKIGSLEFLFGTVDTPAMNLMEVPLPPEDASFSKVYMSVDDKLIAVFIFGDDLKKGAKRVVEQLTHHGYPVALISGDGEETTRAVAEKTGIREAWGGRLPEDKVAFIRSLQKTGFRVAMVGDGINDAPALAGADLAVGVYSGYHLGKEAADVTLMRGDPVQVTTFIQLAAQVNRKVVQNLLCSLVYNTIAIPVAMAGLLTPLVAVGAMLMSSLSVTGNTLLLLKKRVNGLTARQTVDAV